jgi:hypothetical protein
MDERLEDLPNQWPLKTGKSIYHISVAMFVFFLVIFIQVLCPFFDFCLFACFVCFGAIGV